MPPSLIKRTAKAVVAITLSCGSLAAFAQPACVAPPAGLVSWFLGDENALDTTGANHGTLAGQTGYGPGRAGSAFVFDGSFDAVQLGNPASLQLQDFTIETCIKRSSPTVASLNGTQGGVLLQYGFGGYGFGMENDGRLFLTKVGISNVTLTNRIADTNWHHVAVTKSGSSVVFYIDGSAFPTPAYDPGFDFTQPVAIGARGDDLTSSFFGVIDELSIYDHALSAGEIQAIFNAGSDGKCPPQEAPFFISQPGDQSATAFDTVIFAAQAAGTRPLHYQWSFNGTNIPAATNSALGLQLVQVNQAVDRLPRRWSRVCISRSTVVPEVSNGPVASHTKPPVAGSAPGRWRWISREMSPSLAMPRAG